MELLRRALIGGAIAWAAALPAATFIAGQTQPGAPAYLFSLAVYFTGSAVCHQLDARSFHLWAHQMPVCARCTGIYFGAAVAALVALARMFRPREWRSAEAFTIRPPGGFTVHPRTAIGISAIPLFASLIYEWTTGITPSNLTRAATGVVLAATVAWFVVADGIGPAEQTTL